MGGLTWLIRHVVNRIYLWALLFFCGFFFVLLQSQTSMYTALNGAFVWIWLVLSLILSQIEAKFDIEPDIYEIAIERYKKQLTIYRKTKKRKVIAVLVGIEWFLFAINLFTVAYVDKTDTWITFMTRIRYFGLYALGIAMLAMLFQYYMTLIFDTIDVVFCTKRARFAKNLKELFKAEMFHCFHWVVMAFTITAICGFYGVFPYNDKVDAFVKSHFSIKAVIIMIILTRMLTVAVCNCRDNIKTHKVLSMVLIPELFITFTCTLYGACRVEGYVMNAKTTLTVFAFAFIPTFLFGVLPEIRYQKRKKKHYFK